jgi:hypothetical protein
MSTTRAPRVNKSKGSHTFDGKPLVDAEVPTSIPLLQDDIDNAEALRSKGVNDPGRFADCVMAKACKRVFGENAKVRIQRTIAYVSWDGSFEAYRYEVHEDTQKIIRAFDRKKAIKAGTNLILNPPRAARRLDHMRVVSKSWRKKTGATGHVRLTESKVKKYRPVNIELRNGIYARSS